MEANWLMIVLLAFGSSIAAYIGRVWFKRWLNPLSLYSALWCLNLCGYELRLIQYEPISKEAWGYIILAWFSLYLGAGTVLLIAKDHQRKLSSRLFPIDVKRLRSALLLLSVIASIGTADQIRVIMREFGNPLTAIVQSAGEIYLSKVAGELSWFPYLGSLSLPACCLAGIYTARVGRITLLGLIPLVNVALQDIFAMGRLELGIAAVLFFVCFLHTPRETRWKFSRRQKIVGVCLGIIILAGGFAFVSLTRGLGVEFPGITPALESISEVVPVFPSIYSSFSASPVAFSMYLARPVQENRAFWGEYMFAPVARLLSKIGLLKTAERYEETYYTPVPMNISTYLKNLHSDFGPVGVLFFPYLLGAITTGLSVRVERKVWLVALIVLANLYVIVVFSFAFNLMMLGSWYLSLVSGALVAMMVERRTVGATPQTAVKAQPTSNPHPSKGEGLL